MQGKRFTCRCGVGAPFLVDLCSVSCLGLLLPFAPLSWFRLTTHTLPITKKYCPDDISARMVLKLRSIKRSERSYIVPYRSLSFKFCFRRKTTTLSWTVPNSTLIIPGPWPLGWRRSAATTTGIGSHSIPSDSRVCTLYKAISPSLNGNPETMMETFRVKFGWLYFSRMHTWFFFFNW